jgi:hypothetical protein
VGIREGTLGTIRERSREGSMGREQDGKQGGGKREERGGREKRKGSKGSREGRRDGARGKVNRKGSRERRKGMTRATGQGGIRVSTFLSILQLFLSSKKKKL